MRRLVLVLVLLVALLQYKLWLGHGGLVEVSRLKETLNVQQQENAKLQARNRVLETEVRDLKEGLAAVEERARFELGMVKEDEVFYMIVDE
jgi:cell division protein FtsB